MDIVMMRFPTIIIQIVVLKPLKNNKDVFIKLTQQKVHIQITSAKASVGNGKMIDHPSPAPPLKKKKSCLFMSDGWFQKIILLGYDFFVAAIISYLAKVYL